MENNVYDIQTGLLKTDEAAEEIIAALANSTGLQMAAGGPMMITSKREIQEYDLTFSSGNSFLQDIEIILKDYFECAQANLHAFQKQQDNLNRVVLARMADMVEKHA